MDSIKHLYFSRLWQQYRVIQTTIRPVEIIYNVMS
jgi:hypothetical protein